VAAAPTAAEESGLTLPRIILVAVLAHLALSAARLTGSLYALSQGASTFTVGVVIALFALVPMLLAVRTGRWLDAVGSRKPLTLGTALILGGVTLPALFPYQVADIGPLLVASALIGTGSLFVQMTAQHLVGHRAAAGSRAADFSWLALGFSVSGLLGPVASGLLIDAFGHRVTYGAMVGVVLVLVVVLWVSRNQLTAQNESVLAAAPAPMFDLFRHRGVRDVLIATALITTAWDLQSFLVPIHGTLVGLSAAQIGLALGSFSAATFVIRLAMPWLSRSFNEWQVLTFTLVISTFAFALIPLSTALAPLLAVMFLLGLGLGAAQPNVMALLHERAPAGRVGEALGLRVAIINGSSVVLPLVFGAAGAVAGAKAAFWGIALMLAAGSVAAHKRARDSRPRGTAAPQDSGE
jgi:MFS family permease